MAYQPVQQHQRICVHCNGLYYAKDRRRMYCSSSCNTLAWMARRGLNGVEPVDQAKANKPTGELGLTAQNVGTIAVGVLAGNVATAVLSPQPSAAQLAQQMSAVLEHLKRVEAKVDTANGQMLDLKHGVAAGDGMAREAILSSERKRKQSKR